MRIFYWLHNRKIKIKKILLFVLLLLTFNSFAESNFKHLSLQRGLEIDVPKDWTVISGPIKTAIETSAEATMSAIGVDNPNDNTKNILALVSKLPLYAQIRIDVVSPPSASKKEVLAFSAADMNYLGTEYKTMMSKALPIQGFQLMESYGARLEKFKGEPAIIYSYKRSGISGAVLVDMILIFRNTESYTVILSCRESEKLIWNPVLAKVKSSITFN